jgi:hypothetical protein
MRKALVMLGLAAAMACASLLHAQKISHEADLTYTNPQCLAATPCNLQVYRAQCSSTTSCPSFTTSPTSFFALPASTVTGVATVTETVTTAGTTWTFIDTDPTLKDSTTYVWVATDAWQSSPSAASGPSIPFQGATTGPPNSPGSSGKIVR